MSSTPPPDDLSASYAPACGSEADFWISWNRRPSKGRWSPKKVRPESLITPVDRSVTGYDLWGDLVLKPAPARNFFGRLPMEVPAGRYICKPIIGQLQKVPEARGPIPYFCLAMVVAIGPHRGKLVPWYWPYPGTSNDDFWSDCEAAGVHPDNMDLGCGFTAGGVHVVVRDVRKGSYSYRKIASMTKLASLVPTAI